MTTTIETVSKEYRGLSLFHFETFWAPTYSDPQAGTAGDGEGPGSPALHLRHLFGRRDDDATLRGAQVEAALQVWFLILSFYFTSKFS